MTDRETNALLALTLWKAIITVVIAGGIIGIIDFLRYFNVVSW